MVKKIQHRLLVVLMAVAPVILPAQKPVSVVRTIVIDPGHGGKDPGCQGASHREKDVALAVALKLGEYIEQNMKDVKVIYTRTTDVFVDLEERAQVANKAKADLFISIHCNAAGKPVMITDAKTGKKRPKMYRNKKGKLVVVETSNPVPFGSETYVMGLKNEEGKMKVATRENSVIYMEDDYEKKYGGFDPESEESYIIMSNYTSAYVIQSANLAVKIQEEYSRKAGRVDKGVHRQSIWVLWRTSMPSILTEIGYLTNPLEETFLGSAKGQEHMAMALFRGLRKYKDEMEGVKREYNDAFENVAAIENENLKAGSQKKTDEEQTDSEAVAVREKIDTPLSLGSRTAVNSNEKPPEKINDSKNVDIVIEEPDSGAVDPKAIAERYRTNTPAGTNGSENTAAPPASTPAAVKNPVGVVFKVQFASSDVTLNLKQARFSEVSDADFYRERDVLKYTSGKFEQLKDAVAHKNHLRTKGFSDCFVIAVRNGKRIDIEEAKKLTGQ
jgi:N-acetylmuramoyl-L-alanine amidase